MGKSDAIHVLTRTAATPEIEAIIAYVGDLASPSAGGHMLIPDYRRIQGLVVHSNSGSAISLALKAAAALEPRTADQAIQTFCEPLRIGLANPLYYFYTVLGLMEVGVWLDANPVAADPFESVFPEVVGSFVGQQSMVWPSHGANGAWPGESYMTQLTEAVNGFVKGRVKAHHFGVVDRTLRACASKINHQNKQRSLGVTLLELLCNARWANLSLEVRLEKLA